MKNYYSDNLIIGIYEFYKTNHVSLGELEKRFSISKHTLVKRFKKLNLISKVGNTRTLFFNENYFENIDTESKAYWLGFLYADGSIYQNKNRPNPTNFELSLKPSDTEHIKMFAKEINYDLTKVKRFGDRTRLCISSLVFCKHLINKGCTQRKSLTLEFPTFLREDLIRHFIRGYFDGDGHISNPLKTCLGIVILGTTSFLSDILKYYNKTFSKDINNIVKSKKDTKCFQFGLYGQNARDFLNWIYQDNMISLERKQYRYIIHNVRSNNRIGHISRNTDEIIQRIQKVSTNKENFALTYLISKQK